MKIRLLNLLILILLFGQIKADTLSIIQGNNKTYAGEILEIETINDYITGTSSVIARDTVDSLGYFNFHLNLIEIQVIQVSLGIYKAIMFVEPGKNYEIVLPDFHPRTKVDILNPFFKPVEIYLGIKNPEPDDLNLLIANFNEQYHGYIDTYHYDFLKNPRETKVDTLITLLENNFSKNAHRFFSDYREYKYAWLKYISYMRDSRYVIREYFNNKPFLYNNPAYMDLFNQINANFLSFYMNTSEGERLYSDIAYAKSPKYIKETFSNNLVLINDTLQELVLLKGLHDAFFTKDFPVKSMLITLDSIAIGSKVEYHKTIAKNIKRKALKARNGYDAPGFALKDAHGVVRKNTDYLANYVYLNFMSVESYSCQEDLEVLKVLYEKHKNDFRVISISIDDDFEKAKKYFEEKDYGWLLLSYKDHREIIDEYKVRAYPTYYLINPEGILEMAPAPTPAENFEWYFFTLLQNKKRGSRN